MATTNYISERQRYIPNVFSVDPASELNECADKDTKLGDLLARYSVLFKCEQVPSVPINQLKLTRRGVKFYDECVRVFGESFLINENNHFRALIVKNYRGRRIGYNYDENTEILVFDNNGFLAAHPCASHLVDNTQKAFSMVIDDVLYIGFVHERYDASASSDRDTSCTETKTSSTLFSVLGIITDKTDFVPASSLRLFEDNAEYTQDCEVLDQPAQSVPNKIGIAVEDPPVASGPARISRWLKSPEGDLGLFVSMDLDQYATYLADAVKAAGTNVVSLKAISGVSGISTLASAAEIINVLNEIIQIIRNRSKFVFFSRINESKYNIVKDTDSECWFVFNSNDPKDLDLYLIKDYHPFTANSDISVDYKPHALLKGTRFFVQNRERSFSCHLKIKSNSSGKYELESIGDNGLFANSLKQLKLFEEDHGLYAIPLISYNGRMFTRGEAKPYEKGVPCLKVKEPDVMMWIDGVKMVPYLDYRIESQYLNDVCSCQYIKLARLPGTAAASTDPSGLDEDPRDDAIFPLPADGKEYEISIVMAWPRGNFPESNITDGDLHEEAFGLLDRYIGPTTENSYSQYPILAKERQNYASDILLKCSSPVEINVGFDYSKFKMIPVGAITELSTLMFQNGRYLPTGNYKERVAGDRIPVFNSKYNTFQDLEIHFLFDLRIKEIRDILEEFKTEEGNFDFILRHISDANGRNDSHYKSNLKAFTTRITGMDWVPVDDKDTKANESFYGFACWINTNPSHQTGALDFYLKHHGYDSNEDIWLDANRNLDNDGFRSLNVDPTVPNQRTIGEVNDVPDKRQLTLL